MDDFSQKLYNSFLFTIVMKRKKLFFTCLLNVDITTVHKSDTETSQDVHIFCELYHIKSVIVILVRNQHSVI